MISGATPCRPLPYDQNSELHFDVSLREKKLNFRLLLERSVSVSRGISFIQRQTTGDRGLFSADVVLSGLQMANSSFDCTVFNYDDSFGFFSHFAFYITLL